MVETLQTILRQTIVSTFVGLPNTCSVFHDRVRVQKVSTNRSETNCSLFCVLPKAKKKRLLCCPHQVRFFHFGGQSVCRILFLDDDLSSIIENIMNHVGPKIGLTTFKIVLQVA